MLTVALAVASLLGSLTSPDQGGADETAAMITATPTTLPGPSRITASLPDGTQFLVVVEPGQDDEWLETNGSLVMDVGGSRLPVGRVRFRGDVPNTEYSYRDGSYQIPAAGILVAIDFDREILDALGPDAADVIRSGIKGNSVYGFPVLRLREPFAWAGDEPEVTMSVRFTSFEVVRGCGPRAAACSPEGSLQVIWSGPEVASSPSSARPEVRIFRLVP